MQLQQLINRERLAQTFIQLCETDSPSGKEGRMAALVTEMLCALGAEPPFEDDSAAATGSECGNLIFRFAGDPNLEPLFFNCHLDTVEPCIGIKVVRKDDIFTSLGETILGSDDKSGIAAMIEALTVLRENKLSHAPMEFVFTTCEEIGLLGAKALNPEHVRAKMGYALDSTGFGRVIVGAPASNRLRITVRGVAAHA
ncbi:Peptidase family M28, partial [Candidatus Electrothrix communis]